MRVDIGVPVVRADGGRSVHGHVITKFSGMGRFTYPWCSAGACESSAINSSSETQGRSVGPGEKARQKFSSPCLKTFVAPFNLVRLTAAGSPRMLLTERSVIKSPYFPRISAPT